MIVRGTDRVLVMGITGKQGTFWTERMQAYGTRVVAGTHPGKAGTVHCNVPVFATARDAMKAAAFDVAVLFIPPLMVKEAAMDAIEALRPRLPIFFSVHGTGDEEAIRLLKERLKVTPLPTMNDACKAAVEAAKKQPPMNADERQ